MLPVVDKPAIQYVVEEAVDRRALATSSWSPGATSAPWRTTSTATTSWSRRSATRATTERLARVQESSDLATMHYVRQGDPRGLGHAVLCAAPHVGDQPFAVLLGDDLIDPRDPLLRA